MMVLAALRSALFVLWMLVTVVPIAMAVVLASIFIKGTPLYWMCVSWLRLVIWGARVICGVRHRVQGMEHLPTAEQGCARCCWRPSTSPPGRPSPSRR